MRNVPRGAKLVGALLCVLAAVLAAVAVTGYRDSGSRTATPNTQPDSQSASAKSEPPISARRDALIPVSQAAASEEPDQSPKWVSTQELVQRHEALPCTGPKDPINFETFSAGSEVAGLPLTGVSRRCDTASLSDESPSNRITYMYGNCDISESDTGCAPPLQVQTWPACMRNQAGYSFEGKPLPYRDLPSHGGARVVEFDFMLERRIEVYTTDSTIVIFAVDPELARKAVELLIPQEIGKPPVTSRSELQGENPPRGLGAPSDGAIEGELQCMA